MTRIHNLDYLRGLSAVGIMIYHLFTWSYGNYDSGTFLERLGIYGVAIFYILSGITLFHVYRSKLTFARADLIIFFKKRALRILPLLGLITLLTIVISREIPDFTKLFFNLTGLFGLLQWDQYFATGAWSIGNELVFYLFFPFFILFYNKSKIALVITSLIIFCVFMHFSFFVLDSNVPLSAQWHNYVNPLNQVFLFLSGVLIGAIFQNMTPKFFIAVSSIIFGFSIFTFYPVSGDAVNLVTGANRLIFSFSCMLICFGVFKIDWDANSFIHQPLKYLGDISFSVYLLHPVIYLIIKFICSRYFSIIPLAVISISILATVFVSYIVYEYYEKYFMKMGKPVDLKTTIVNSRI